MNKNTIILIADTPILNPAETKIYLQLSTNYSVFLNTLLFSNWIEILSSLGEQNEIFLFLNSKDQEYLPKYFLPPDAKVIFYEGLELTAFSEYISKYISTNNLKTLILFNNSIGLNQNDITRAFSLIQSDEPSMVIGKSNKDQIIFTCTSGIESDLVDPIFSAQRIYSDYLSLIASKDIFIHSMENFSVINDFEDIKKLYIELSKKESLSYCSPKMHESFNDLFIEYKDLLNV